METEKDENSKNEAESIFANPQDEKGNTKLQSENVLLAPKVTLSVPQEGENESFEVQLMINEEDEYVRGLVRLSDLQQDSNIRENRTVNIEERLFEEQLILTKSVL